MEGALNGMFDELFDQLLIIETHIYICVCVCSGFGRSLVMKQSEETALGGKAIMIMNVMYKDRKRDDGRIDSGRVYLFPFII